MGRTKSVPRQALPSGVHEVVYFEPVPLKTERSGAYRGGSQLYNRNDEVDNTFGLDEDMKPIGFGVYKKKPGVYSISGSAKGKKIYIGTTRNVTDGYVRYDLRMIQELGPRRALEAGLNVQLGLHSDPSVMDRLQGLDIPKIEKKPRRQRDRRSELLILQDQRMFGVSGSQMGDGMETPLDEEDDDVVEGAGEREAHYFSAGLVAAGLRRALGALTDDDESEMTGMSGGAGMKSPVAGEATPVARPLKRQAAPWIAPSPPQLALTDAQGHESLSDEPLSTHVHHMGLHGDEGSSPEAKRRRAAPSSEDEPNSD